MFKIGPFSRIAQVPVSQLRYYDEVGLFKPAHVDSSSGYRYYTVDQLPQLNQIVALRNLDLSIEQIKQLLNDNISPDQIRGMFLLKKAQIEQQLQTEAMRLAGVQYRLKQLEQTGILSAHDVMVKSVPEQWYLSRREIKNTLRDMGAMFGELTGVLKQNAIPIDLPDQHLVAVFHVSAFIHQQIDWELGCILASAGVDTVLLTDGRSLALRRLEAVKHMATVVHAGAWAEIGLGYQALGRWLEANGYAWVGPSREVFLKIAGWDDATHPVIELQFPIQPIAQTHRG